MADAYMTCRMSRDGGSRIRNRNETSFDPKIQKSVVNGFCNVCRKRCRQARAGSSKRRTIAEVSLDVLDETARFFPCRGCAAPKFR